MSIIFNVGGIGKKHIGATKKKKNPHASNKKKAIQWGQKYNEAVNQWSVADGYDDEKGRRKYAKMEENAWEKYNEYLEQLPKYEQKDVEKIVNL